MKRTLLALCGALFAAISGFFAILLGVCLSSYEASSRDGTLVFALVGLAVAAPLGFGILKVAFQAGSRDLTSLSWFILACGASGLAYDRVLAPEGFKLLGLALLLLTVGWLSARRVARRLRQHSR